ncbi:hypothetical protein [Ktedonobacter racemifer]|uniref:Uncharacterized protein n=1 Tax=Ktedonobacter racemifer DSM 44963 TaxID=485913 RepID=D6U217_KTERA|nr:hypothetical protein [Ktedonobacter racemifer]EFH80901.1 hypothetical protein Krac_1534 [Ktedonobacter racemifer DSM 44963]
MMAPERQVLGALETKKSGKGIGNAEERDRHLTRRWSAPIASQALLKREAIVRTLRAGDDFRRRSRWRSKRWMKLYLQVLGTHQLDAGAPIEFAIPIAPENWGRSDGIVKLMFEVARSSEKTLAERTRGGGNWRKGPLCS